MKWWKGGDTAKIVREGSERLLKEEVKPGRIIPYDEIPKAEEPPPPDLSTKPEDIIGYCFAYVCPKKHIGQTFENITVDGYGARQVCNTCGGVAKTAVVKRISEARWDDCAYPNFSNPYPKPDWKWYNRYVNGYGKSVVFGEILWNRYEFVRFLESPKPRRKK